VLQLPRPQRCTDATALALERRAPSDAAARDALRRIEAELAAAEAVRRLGRNREALARLDALVEPAAAVQWAPIVALLDFRRAQLHLNIGEHEAARELGERSFFAAYRAGDERTATYAAALVSQYFVISEMNPGTAQHWDELASAALARIQGDATPPALFRAVVAGRRHMVLGELEDGELELERALAFGEQLYGTDHLALSEILLVLSNLQSRRFAFPESRATAARAYAINSTALGEDHPLTARALAGLALAVHYDGYSEEALAYLERALAIDEHLDGWNHVHLAVDLSYTALVLQESGYDLEAIARLERALPIFRTSFGVDHPEVELVLGNLARAQHSAGMHREARASIEAAIAMHERTGSTDEATADANFQTRARIERSQAERR
jgi:tetratricopeptide (TPR) repeat protein